MLGRRDEGDSFSSEVKKVYTHGWMSDEFILMNSLRRKENMYGPEEGGYVHGTNSSLLPLLCKCVFIAEEFGVCAQSISLSLSTVLWMGQQISKWFISQSKSYNTFMILRLIQLCEFISTSLTMQTCFHSSGIWGMCTDPFLSPPLLYFKWVNKYSDNLSVNLNLTTHSWFWCWFNYANSSLLPSLCKHVFIAE